MVDDERIIHYMDRHTLHSFPGPVGVKMLTLKKGEAGRKSTTVENDVATCIHQTVHSSLDDGARYQLTWMIDFADMNHADILAMAAEHIIIKIRRDFAKCDKPENDDWNNVTFDAKDYVTKRVDKTEKIAKQIATMTDDEKAALLELINS